MLRRGRYGPSPGATAACPHCHGTGLRLPTTAAGAPSPRDELLAKLERLRAAIPPPTVAQVDAEYVVRRAEAVERERIAARAVV
jgi:hypothetical protein